MTSYHRARAAVVVTAVAALAVVMPAGPDASAESACDGVWVVVDATAAGGDLSATCVTTDPADGYAALTTAGHTTTDVPGIPGMVCTIDGVPDPCNRAPADAYWSYWYAEQADGPWSYATVGAASRRPVTGGIEGWRFGDGSEPPGGTLPPDAGSVDDVVSISDATTDDEAPSTASAGFATALLVGLGWLTWTQRRRRSAGAGS